MISRYFAKEMKLSQTYNEGNHKPHVPADYPIDETYNSTNGIFYAPFDFKIVKRYKADTMQIWCTSTEEVETPIGNYFVTFMLCHLSLYEFNNLTLNKVFKQGEPVAHEAKDSMSTGYHNHITAGIGTIKGSGWKKYNNKWCLTTTLGTRPPEEIFYITDFTKVIDNRGLNFKKYENAEPIIDTKTYYVTLDDMIINKEPKVGTPVKYKDCYPTMQKALKYTEPNATAVIKKGTTITCLELLKKGKYTWIKNYNGYICQTGASGKVYCKKLNEGL